MLIAEPYNKGKQRVLLVFSCSPEQFTFLRYKVLSSQKQTKKKTGCRGIVVQQTCMGYHL